MTEDITRQDMTRMIGLIVGLIIESRDAEFAKQITYKSLHEIIPLLNERYGTAFESEAIKPALFIYDLCIALHKYRGGNHCLYFSRPDDTEKLDRFLEGKVFNMFKEFADKKAQPSISLAFKKNLRDPNEPITKLGVVICKDKEMLKLALPIIEGAKSNGK